MIIVANANSNDRGVTSRGTNYNTILGGNQRLVTNDTYALVGQLHQVSNNWYYVRQYFTEFTYNLPAGQLPVAGHFFLRHSNAYGTSTARDLEVREFDWGGTVTTDSWRTPTELAALNLAAVSYDVNRAGSDTGLYIGARSIAANFASSATKRYVVSSSRNRRQVTPPNGSREDNNISQSGHSSGTPRLVMGATTQNLMQTVLAAQIQLSDGSWILAEKTDVDRSSYSMQLRRVRPDGSDHIIWGPTTPVDLSNRDAFRGSHVVSLARDNNDNIFMCDGNVEDDAKLILRTFVKDAVETWNPLASRTISVPEDDASSNIQSVQMVYHNVGGGRLVSLAFRDWGVLGGTQEVYTLISVPALLSGSSQVVLDQGRGGEKGFTAYPANPGRYNPLNPTGTLLDLHADAYDPRIGYVCSGERHATLGNNASVSLGRYQLSSNGNSFTNFVWSFLDESGGFSTYDPDAKLRVISTGQLGHFVKITADAREDWGLTVDSMYIPPTENRSVRYSTTRFDAPSVAVNTLPDYSSISTSMAWDAIYFPPDNSIWIYYLDKDNPRRLMRTAIRMGTNQAQQNEVQVVAEFAPSGHTIHAIRVQRNRVVDDQILITAASQSGASHSYQYYVDRINVAPTQPTLTAVANYDATTDKDFSWTFNDANFNDTQSAYELQILKTSDSSVAYTTGKASGSVTTHTVPGSSIANNDSYMWRVRVWDSVDEASVWSNFSTFATSDTGIVSITDPAMDNDPDIFSKSYLIKWTVSGAGQDEYRVILNRTLDNSLFYDSGWVSSAVQEHLVSNLESDVEYLITVRARASLVESSPATRLMLTHFNTVEQPIVSLQVHRECILISVVNPEPRGDRPHPTINRIYRRLLGSTGPFQFVGSCLPNESFRDYSVASDTRYEYKVRTGVEL